MYIVIYRHIIQISIIVPNTAIDIRSSYDNAPKATRQRYRNQREKNICACAEKVPGITKANKASRHGRADGRGMMAEKQKA